MVSTVVVEPPALAFLSFGLISAGLTVPFFLTRRVGLEKDWGDTRRRGPVRTPRLGASGRSEPHGLPYRRSLPRITEASHIAFTQVLSLEQARAKK